MICEYCKVKKTYIIPYTCKCGYVQLCTLCRLPESHRCTFDYKTIGKEILKANNPLIIHNKIIII